MQNSNLQLAVDAIDSEVTALDVKIAELRRQKLALIAKRSPILSEIEIMAKLGNLTAEQRQRIILRPDPATATFSAAK